LPDTPVTPLPIDLSDQAIGDQINIVSTTSQPKAKKQGKTSETADESLADAQPEQVATSATQEQAAMASEQKPHE
jgi:hypothetical protein